MGGGNKIDIVAARILKINHHAGYLPVCHLLAFTLVADVVILTKNAQQITKSKKYCAGTVFADKGRFFSIMLMIA